MNSSIRLVKALCLPAPDIEALIQGRMIVAIPRVSVKPDQHQFALYPCNTSINSLPVELYYRSNFLPIAHNAVSNINSQKVLIKAWARCERREYLYNADSFDVLSKLTVWKIEALNETLRQHEPRIFLTYLRVYLLPEPIQISAYSEAEQKNGKFISLPERLIVTDSSPVLSDRIFSQRRHQLENRIPPLHPELEELQSQVAQIAINNPKAEILNHQIQRFLGWVSNPIEKLIDTDLSWINTINALGNATTGGKFQKGDAFEKIVRKSLAFLGFDVDPNAKGGAGGMDLYCTKPYTLVGECKAGKSIPDNTVEELSRIGKRHLGKDAYEIGVKLIIGPGEPTRNLKESAKVSIISIIKPMTLQKLVELQAKYPGSVNLIELKPYLEAGQIDSKIEEYIDKVEKEIKLRSHLVTLIKNYLENTGMDSAGVEALHGAYFGSNPPKPLTTNEMREILIELSSPLTGYLGRKKGSDGSDRFYYLRDLIVEEEKK